MIKEKTIPKVIHYCWFGGNQEPDDAKKCIESWKKFFPNYEIKKWDESNFDITSCDYVKEAYSAKKWAYVSDYARFWILYKYGGIYFDTDVEVICKFDEIISKGAFMGKESSGCVAPGLGLGLEAGNGLIKELLDLYETSHFMKEGKADSKTVVDYTTEMMKKRGLIGNDAIEVIDNIIIYPKEYFCPIDHLTGKLIITENTKSIHYYTASWYTERGRKWIKIEQLIRKGLGLEKSRVIIESLPWVFLRMLCSNGIKETMLCIKKKVRRKRV